LPSPATNDFTFEYAELAIALPCKLIPELNKPNPVSLPNVWIIPFEDIAMPWPADIEDKTLAGVK